jgi:hypothetical protein
MEKTVIVRYSRQLVVVVVQLLHLSLDLHLPPSLPLPPNTGTREKHVVGDKIY